MPLWAHGAYRKIKKRKIHIFVCDSLCKTATHRSDLSSRNIKGRVVFFLFFFFFRTLYVYSRGKRFAAFFCYRVYISILFFSQTCQYSKEELLIAYTHINIYYKREGKIKRSQRSVLKVMARN